MSAPSVSRPVRAVAYFRMSTQDQDDSIPQQIEWAEKAAERERVAIVERFADEGVKGHDTRKRTAFHAMLAFCQAEQKAGRPIDAVVCWHLNRFSRADSQETGWFLWEFRKAGVRYILTNERWHDLDRLEDRLLMGVQQEAACHKFSVDLAGATGRGMTRKAKGQQPVAPPPFGYNTTYESPDRGGKLRPVGWSINPAEASIVRRLFRDYASGQHTLRSIADALNREGVPGPAAFRKRRLRPQDTGKWNVASIRVILINESYLGHHLWGRQQTGVFACCIDGEFRPRPQTDRGKKKNVDPSQVIRRENAHDAIVDEETFRRVQTLLARNKRSPVPGRGRAVYLFTGILRCGLCGKTMAGNHGYTDRWPTAYLCQGYRMGGQGACDCNNIYEARMLNALSAALQERLTCEFLDGFEARVREHLSGQQDDTAGRLEALRAALADVEAQLVEDVRRAMRLPDGLRETAESVALATKARRDELAREVAIAEAASAGQQDAGQDVEGLVQDARAEVQRMHEVLRDGDRATVRAFFRDNLDRIVVYFDPKEDGVRRDRFDRAMVYLRKESPLCCLLYRTELSSIRDAKEPAFIIDRTAWQAAR